MLDVTGVRSFGNAGAFLWSCITLLFLMGVVAAQDTGLVAHWDFDEGSGNTLHDKTVNHNDGAIYGAIWVDGIKGGALSFDGVDDYIEVPDSSSLDISGNEISIEAWVYPYQIECSYPEGYKSIVSKYHTEGYYLRINPCKAIEFYGSGTIESSKDVIPIGSWSYIVGTFDGTFAKIYLNGKLIKTAQTCFPGPCSVQVNDYPLRIGMFPGGDLLFNGVIDEVRIYNRLLSDDEISDRYQSLTGSSTTIPEFSTIMVPIGIALFAGLYLFKRQ